MPKNKYGFTEAQWAYYHWLRYTMYQTNETQRA